MRRILITFLCAVMTAMAGQRAMAFSLLGPSLAPDSTWQTPTLGYNLGGFDVGAPKQIGQGYRRNEPNVYYAYDQNFLDFFSTNGEAAVDGAFAIMNALSNADSIQLSQFPLNSQLNYGAGTLGLMDLKSLTLGELMEQMGLAPPVRYVWTLHDRYLPSGAACSTNPLGNGEEYLVVQRNIDPVTQSTYTSFVDGTLYSYELFESCGTLGVFPDDINGLTVDALASPLAVDLDAQTYQPVAEAMDIWAVGNDVHDSPYYDSGALVVGGFYTGLTYDDAGGLRYLYSTNNYNTETPAPGSLLEATNTSQLLLLQTANLYTLMQFAQTNPPAAVETEFPGIVVNGFSTYYTLVTNYNVYSYFTNYPGSSAFAPPVFVTGTNGFTLSAQTNYVYSFGNVVYVHYYSNTPAQLVTVSLTEEPGSPYQSPVIIPSVTTKKVILTNVISGDYYLIPAGSCGYQIVSTLVSNYFAGAVTNIITMATNAASTNSVISGFVGSESIVTRFTNDWFEYYACNFTNPSPEFYQGIGKVNFIKAEFDSTAGQYWPGVTNYYSMVMAVGGKLVTQHFQRIVTQPDILLDASDLASPAIPLQIGLSWPPFARNVTYTEDPQVQGSEPASGPGTITDYPTTISYNNVGNIYFVSGSYVNATNAFLGTEAPLFQWGSFDESTNAPTVYPVGFSLQNLENEILIQISPTTLPDATNGVPYSETFVTTGGSFTAPYSWSLGVNSTLVPTSLPAGLSLSSGGTISGTPAASDKAGTYDFVLQMTDYNGRSVTWNYSINIDP